MPDTAITAAQFKEALGVEWGTYVAVTEIDINGARAFNTGDPVPVTHVTNEIVADWQVKKVTTKAGRAAAGLADESKG